MGKNSVVGQVGNFFTSAFTSPKAPQAASAPSTSQPTIQDANTDTTQQQLTTEQQQASANTQLTSGQGLTDEPTTASQSLLGS